MFKSTTKFSYRSPPLSIALSFHMLIKWMKICALPFLHSSETAEGLRCAQHICCCHLKTRQIFDRGSAERAAHYHGKWKCRLNKNTMSGGWGCRIKMRYWINMKNGMLFFIPGKERGMRVKRRMRKKRSSFSIFNEVKCCRCCSFLRPSLTRKVIWSLKYSSHASGA